MDEMQEKINQLKWLQYAGIEYYCSHEKDSKNLLMKKFRATLEQEQTQKKQIIGNKTGLKQTVQQNSNKSQIQGNNMSKPSTKQAAIQEDTKNVFKTASSRTIAEQAQTIDDLRNILENFDGCKLKNFATNTVFADGNPNADILLVGEAPGATEDQEGRPFCGESGQLLDKMLKTIGLDREENIYITNTVFWRPPANRRPTSEEIEICRPFVEKHIALLKPKLIILVGGTATSTLLGKNNISDIRENYYSYSNCYLEQPVPTTALFHPAYLLRQPSRKKDTWFNLLKIKQYLAS